VHDSAVTMLRRRSPANASTLLAIAVRF